MPVVFVPFAANNSRIRLTNPALAASKFFETVNSARQIYFQEPLVPEIPRNYVSECSNYFMKKPIFLILLLCLTALPSFAQKRKTPVKAAPTIRAPQKTSVALSPAAEISNAEWNRIIAALDKEDWAQAANLSSLALGKLKSDNDKKQLARLRYFYVYSLAGKVATGKMTYSELEKTVGGFVGKDFLMPSRMILASCSKNLNYICPVKTDENAVRVTATNKTGTAIHSFERVEMAEKIDLEKFSGRQAFVGGTLKTIEFNPEKSDTWIMRLVFERGFVNIVAGR